MGLKFGIFGGFVLRSSVLDLGLGLTYDPILAKKFRSLGFFGGVQKGLEFGFGG